MNGMYGPPLVTSAAAYHGQTRAECMHGLPQVFLVSFVHLVCHLWREGRARSDKQWGFLCLSTGCTLVLPRECGIWPFISGVLVPLLRCASMGMSRVWPLDICTHA